MTDRSMTKLRILAASLADAAVDIFVPTIVYLALRPLGVPVVLAMTTGCLLVAAKAGLGKLERGLRLAGRDWLLLGSTALAIAALFALYGLGASLVVSVVAGSVVQAVGVGIVVLGRRSLDGFALLVLVELGLSVVLAFVSSNDPRYFAIRPVFYLLVGAIVVAGSCFGDKPAIYTVSRPMAVAGDPRLAVAYDRVWRSSATFRRLERGATIAFALVLFVGCAAWVYLAFQFTASQFLAANSYSQLPLIGLVVLFFAVFRIGLVPKLSRLVLAEQARIAAEPAEPAEPAEAGAEAEAEVGTQ